MTKYSLIALFSFAVFALQAQETERKLDAHPSNFRSWSMGLNVGSTFSMGDAVNFEADKGDLVPDGIGGFEFGVRGQLTKWFTPSLGITGSGGYHSTSGTQGNRYFDGYYLDGDLSLSVNLSNWLLRGYVGERKSALLFNIGLGGAIMNATNGQGTSIGGDRGYAIQTTIPLQLNYKYMLSEGLDLDVLYKHTFTSQDFPDVIVDGSTADMFGYAGIGVTYNFGKEGEQSVVYSNPLDDMYNNLQTIREDYDELVADTDGDGVSDKFDQDNSTPADVAVNGSGVAQDADMDGIPDYLDADPFTMKGAKVDSEGRAVDSDGDGVPDAMDQEANTPKGAVVNFQGREVSTSAGVGGGSLPSVFFAFNSATVTAANHYRLATIARTMKANPDVKVTLVGYADKRGPEDYNRKLADRRAEEVAKQLTQVYGIDAGRISTSSEGETAPLADGRYDVNRRVDVNIQD